MTIRFAVAAVFLLSSVLSAEVITDPANDFLASYTGPHNGDLDVISAEVLLEGSTFTFTSTSNAPIGTTPDGVFVWGVNRGSGSQTFPGIAPGVTFDAVVIIVPGGDSFVLDIDNAGAMSPIPAANISVNGADLSATVQVSQLPTRGAAPADYTVNLWPRSELLLIDEVISDFAPDNSNAAVTVIPEPGMFGLVGLGIAGVFLRRRVSQSRRQ